MFTERLNELFEILGTTNTELARFAGCDRSLISRIKSGSRIPKPSSASIEKLINGLFMYADDRGKIDKLLEVVSYPSEDKSPDEIKRHILLHLYEGYTEQDIQSKQKNKKAKNKVSRVYDTKSAYGAKLNAIINIADISNVRLSKILHIDASTISRFRKGLRMPKANHQLTYDICDTLFERIWELNRLPELLKLTEIPVELANNKEECRDCFRNWLCDFNTETSNVFVENLLDNISSFSADIKMPLPGLNEAAPDKILQDKESIYYGTDGIRTAVIRFLGNAIQNRAKELWLYSDQNMDWMTHDISFRLKWMSLMRECVKCGTKIRIIHSINRDLEEMTNAINNWLPLYMSGMIESYYCKKQGDGKFSTTIFLCPEMACISSVHVLGCEDKGIYRYDTDEKVLNVHKINYTKLLSRSKPLVTIYRGTEEVKNIYSDSRGITAVLGSLSLATMPETLLKSMIKRNNIDDDVSNKVLSEWKTANRLFAYSLKSGFVHECICLAADELLFSGKVSVDLRSASLTYTPQEYKEHIKNIIAFSESNPNYRFYALPDTPFSNIAVVVSENSVMATRLLPPQTVFVFSHPSMCEAFSGYVKQLKEQYNRDKITTKRLLERYV